jgi:hypothetical protein
MRVYVQSTKNPELRFEVVTYDSASKTATLRGEFGAQFTRDMSKASLQKYGYEIVESETPLPLTAPPKVKKPTKKEAPPADDDDE